MRIYFSILFFYLFLAINANENYVLINNKAQIKENKNYVLVTKDVSSGSYFILSDEAFNDKIKAKKLKNFSSKISLEKAPIWHFIKNKDQSYSLQSLSKKKMICLNPLSSTSFILSSNHVASFTLLEHSDNSFYFKDYVLQDGNLQERYLSLNNNGKLDYYFGNFVKFPYSVPNIYIFVLEDDNIEIHGNTFFPKDGERVALHIEADVPLVATNKFSLSNDLLTQDISENILSDSTLAPYNLSGVFEVSHLDGKKFILKNKKGFLQIIQQSDSSGTFAFVTSKKVATPFYILKGCICCGTEKKMLLASEKIKMNLVKCLPFSTKMDIFMLPVDFVRIANDPHVVYDSQSIAHFHGGWTYDELLNHDFNSYSVIDFTSVALPIKHLRSSPLVFPNNVLTFVEQKDLSSLSNLWPNVIEHVKTYYHAASIIKLKDNEPFFSPVDFYVGEDSICYSREVYQDDGYETMVLPFSITKSMRSLNLYKFKELKNDLMFFKSSDTIYANESFLIQSKLLSSGSEQNALFKGASQVIKASENLLGTNLLHGVLDTLIIENENPNIYFLSKDGKSFVHPLAGSKLLPFHSFIEIPNDHFNEMLPFKVSNK